MTVVQPWQITGLVLAGGRGSRMGGVDKGLQAHGGSTLAQHALRRLQAQVGRCMVNANRHLADYARFGVPVWPDELPDYAGPLAGFITGLRHCDTEWLVTVPCDSPLFPEDLVARMAARIGQAGSDIAVALAPEADAGAATGLRPQPVFCLMHTRVLPALERFVAGGGRKIDAWTQTQASVLVPFDDARAFLNVNTLAELQALEACAAPGQPTDARTAVRGTEPAP